MSVLNHQFDNTTNTAGITTSDDLNFDQDTYNSEFEVQENENQGSPQAVYLEIPQEDVVSPISAPIEQETTIARLDNYFLDNNPIDDFLEDDQQDHNVVLRDRSQPREWKTVDLAHDVPIFEKLFQPMVSDTHKTTPLFSRGFFLIK